MPSVPYTWSIAGRTAIVVAALVLAACGSLPTPSGPAVAGAPDAEQLREPRYLRFRPEDTGLVAVHDDGRDTYLEFAQAVPRHLTIHDHDGRTLSAVVSASVVAVPGLHAGLLVRRDDVASFAAPNPRRRLDLTQPLPDRAEFIDARARLQGGGQLQTAMSRAMAAASPALRAGLQPETPLATAGVPVPPAAAAPVGQWVSLQAPPASLQAAGGLQTAIAPLTAANLMAVQPEEGLLRVYFASASRAIVAPDDGLATLLREATRADRIRITGHTDAVGPRTANLTLARSRADAVAEILVRRGIEPTRIEVAAIAADAFIADNDTDRGRALNRRAEVQLLRDGRPLRLGPVR